MDRISFSLGCRACRETSTQRSAYDYDDDGQGAPLASRSDFGVMRVVEMLNKDLGAQCPFCHSPYLEVFDLAVNAQALFEYEALCQGCDARGLAVLSLTISKVGNRLDTRLLAHPTQVPVGFLLLMLDKVADLVEERPAHDFAPDPTGSFYGCVAGRWDADPQKRLFYPQKYTCRGLTKAEAVFAIRTVREDTAAA